MFSALRRAFGAISVVENATDIVVSGVPADMIARDISKLWTTQRINSYMFTKIGKNGFAFPKFFAIEIHYMLQQLARYKQGRSSKKAIKAILHELEENTWLKRMNEEPTHRLNFARLADLNYKLFDHQHGFLKYYDTEPNRLGLLGALAAADPGTGKTIMGLAIAHCLEADLIVILSPKVALDRVWVDTIGKLYKKTPTLWNAVEGKPYKGEKIILGHYEALPKVKQVAVSAPHTKVAVIVDESHNFNEVKSLRTQLLVQMVRELKCEDILPMSGTPLKAMGYEMIPILRMIDPLFTPDVEARFLKIFGKESGRAVDILRHRIGKVAYKIEGAEVISNETRDETIHVKLPGAERFTLEAIRTQMRAYADQRTAHYAKYFKLYRSQYEEGIEAFEAVMSPEQKKDLRRYQAAVKMIAKGYDPAAHKAEAEFANHFENKVIIPSIKDKRIRDGFKESKSVIKYVALKIMGEALANVVGKARMQVHLEMVKTIDWKAIAEKSRKKVIVFTSYVEVVKALEAAISAAGFKHATVYGDTSANVAGIVSGFAKNDDEKFLIATYQSLSTAVPLTMADVSVFTNAPWRDHEMKQAKARTDRIGQDGAVLFIHTYLDTGDAPNISTRSKDILEWSREQVEAMMGPNDMSGVSAELTKDINAKALEAYSEPGTGFCQAFDDFLAHECIEEAFGENDRPTTVNDAALEALMERKDRKDSFKRRLLIRALGLFAYIPELTFDESDVDQAVVKKLMAHPEHLQTLQEWIETPHQELVPKLWKAKHFFDSVKKPKVYPKLYRGFNPKSLEQDTMGLQRQGFFGPKSAKFAPGDTFTYATKRALSFTHHPGTASVYGGVVITIDPAKHLNHLLDISPEVCYAIWHSADDGTDKPPYYTTYGEFILLPSDHPIDFHVDSVNGKHGRPSN